MKLFSQLRKKESWLVFGGTLCIFFSFGFYHLGQFITADEHLWINKRIENYWTAIMKGDLRKTYINDKPGITLALVSLPGYLKYPNPLTALSRGRAMRTGSTDKTEALLETFRIPILFLGGLFSLYLYWILKKMTKNRWIALWSSILTLLSPVIIGISQIVNPDALMWGFVLATIFSYLAYLDLREKKLLYLTSFFLGMAMLTKYTSTILMPFLFFMLVDYYFEKLPTFKDKKGLMSHRIKKDVLEYLMIISGAILVFAIFLPASFYSPKAYLYDGTVGFSIMPVVLLIILSIISAVIADAYWKKSAVIQMVLEKTKTVWKWFFKSILAFLAAVFLALIFNYYFGREFLNLEAVPFDSRQTQAFKDADFLRKILLEYRPIVFSLTPTVIFLVMYAWIKSIISDLKYKKIIYVLSAFIFFYNFAAIQQGVLNILRYSIIIFPLFSVLAAIGAYHLVSNLRIKKQSGSPVLASFIIIGAGIINLWLIKPFYFNYTNFLLPKRYITVDSWGYGGYEAAKYLNSLPGAENKLIWTDYYGVCEFYRGKCVTDYNVDESEKKIDYLVLTRRGEIRYRGKIEDVSFLKRSRNLLDLDPYYQSKNFLWELEIDDRPENSIKIFTR